MSFPLNKMLENAACASQHTPIVDDQVVRGALLRSIHQWLTREHYKLEDAICELERHSEFDQ